MDVDMTLFPRADMRVVGIAPLTSMFLFDETNRGRLDDYRPEVHDSDGLQITSKSRRAHLPAAGEPDQAAGLDVHDAAAAGLRPGAALARPARLPGLRQPVRAAPERMDRAEGRVGRRARSSSSRFRRGARATTTSWHSGGRRRASPAGHPAEFAYRITWLAEPALPKGLGTVVATRSGASLDGKRRVFILDFVGAGEKTDGLRLDLGASAGKISNRHAAVERHDARPARELRDRSERRRTRSSCACASCAATAGHRNLAVSMDRSLSSAVHPRAPERRRRHAAGSTARHAGAGPARQAAARSARAPTPPCCSRASSWSP